MKRKEPIKKSKSPVKAGRGGDRLSVAWGDSRAFNVPIPKDEPERLADLKNHRVLDTSPEEALDHLTRLAAEICGAPIALVSLIDKDRQWFKSKVGIKVSETPREYAFCAHAIMAHELFVVRDASQDERFAGNPLVVSGPKIRFYAGAPLVSPENHALGTLCVIDRVPRTLDRGQEAILQILSQQVMAQLVMRRHILELRDTLKDRKRIEKQLQKTIRLTQIDVRGRSKLLEDLNRDMQEAALSIESAADQMAAGGLAAVQKRQVEHLRTLARALSLRCNEILRVSRM